MFEWHSFKIVGYRVVPARLGSYKVRKVPFMEIGWIGVSHKEMPACLLDPDWAQLVPEILGVDGNGRNEASEPHLSQPLQIPVSPKSAARKNACSSSGSLRLLDLDCLLDLFSLSLWHCSDVESRLLMNQSSLKGLIEGT